MIKYKGRTVKKEKERFTILVHSMKLLQDI